MWPQHTRAMRHPCPPPSGSKNRKKGVKAGHTPRRGSPAHKHVYTFVTWAQSFHSQTQVVPVMAFRDPTSHYIIPGPPWLQEAAAVAEAQILLGPANGLTDSTHTASTKRLLRAPNVLVATPSCLFTCTCSCPACVRATLSLVLFLLLVPKGPTRSREAWHCLVVL